MILHRTVAAVLAVGVLVCSSFAQAGGSPAKRAPEDVLRALKAGPARLLVVLDVPPSRSTSALASAVAASQDRALRGLDRASYRVLSRMTHVPVMAIEADLRTAQALLARPEVKAIQLDRQRRRFDAGSFALTGIADVQSTGATGEGIRVAVVDTGINGTHVSLQDDLVAEGCFRTEGDCPAGTDGPGSALDQDGHGTHVAGTITGATGNAPDAEVIALKVFTTGDTSDTNILNALDAVVANHASWQTRVVNMSLGGGNYADQASCDADSAAYVATFAQLNALGISVFVATGNDASSSSVSSPGCATGAIGVGSVSDDVFTVGFAVCTENGQPDKVTCFSNTTATQGEGELVDLLAPGCLITAEWVGSSTATNAICGTSMATPTAAGIAAALLSQEPTLTPAELEDLLESTGDPVEDYRNGVSYPRVNANAAYAELAITLPTPAGLTATAVGATQVDLAWGDIEGESGYQVQRSSDGASWGLIDDTAANATSHSDAAPACGTMHYRVRGVGAGGYSAFSNVAMATARACPQAPTGLTATVLDPATVQLAWTDNASGEDAYEVEVAVDGAPFQALATLPADSVDHQHSGFGCAAFQYRVRAFEAAGADHSAWSNVAAANPCAPANDLLANAQWVSHNGVDEEGAIRHATVSAGDPAPSCRYSGPAVGSNNVWYRITPEANALVTIDTLASTLVPPDGGTEYNDTLIAVYTGAPGALVEVACNEDVSGTNFLSQLSHTMEAGTTYWVLVTRWSEVAMSWDGVLRTAFDFGEAPPVLGASAGAGTVDLSWTTVPSATAYRVERKLWNGSSWTEIAQPEGTEHVDPQGACEVFDYRVRAFDGVALGAYSNEVRAEPAGCNQVPANDLLANAESIGSGSHADIEANVRYASRSATDPQFVPDAGRCLPDYFPASGTNTLWYVFEPTRHGLLTVATVGSVENGGGMDSVVGVYTGSPGALVQAGCDDQGGGDDGTSLLADVAVAAGTTYWVHVARWSSTPTTSTSAAYTVTFDFVPLGDAIMKDGFESP